MGAGEWIAVVTLVVMLCLTIGGSAIAVVVKVSSLEISLKHLASSFAKFEASVERTHRDMWRAINHRNENCEESE